VDILRTDARPERQEYYRRIAASSLAPLWEVLHDLVPEHPRSSCVPAGWRYGDVRPHLVEAGRQVTAKEAERRVLILENPALRGQSCVTQTLYAGLQLLLPGEVARSHRHTQSALRLILEGEGAYTAVEGERSRMCVGDLVITPSGTWHDHGNPGDVPVIWLDGLDIPLVRLLAAGFAEKYPHESQPVMRPDDDSDARFGSNLAPIDHTPEPAGASPLINYRFTRTRAALQEIARAGEADPWRGHAMRFLHPMTGGSPLPTIGTYVQWLPRSFTSRPYRSTDGRVFCCLSGQGRIEAQGWSFEFEPRDVFVIPGWIFSQITAVDDTVLFSFSDRPVQQALGLWREERAT
jgi:gentisate 1,2-dioxygenase